jgi:hypothetical protein
MVAKGRIAGFAAAFALTAHVASAGERAVCAAPEEQGRPRQALRTGSGFDGRRAWLAAEYRGLQVRKSGSKEENTFSTEFRHGRDAVTLTLSAGVLSVSRGRQTVVVDSADAVGRVQTLLAASTAVFGARALLSELESTSNLKAQEMTLLASAAVLASLVGDTGAPRRLSDRFVEKHRGIFRQIRGDEAGCWDDYTSETVKAWDELQECMEDSYDDGFFSGVYQRIACNAIWIGRSESAWFEYLKCIGPFSSIPK